MGGDSTARAIAFQIALRRLAVVQRGLLMVRKRADARLGVGCQYFEKERDDENLLVTGTNVRSAGSWYNEFCVLLAAVVDPMQVVETRARALHRRFVRLGHGAESRGVNQRYGRRGRCL